MSNSATYWQDVEDMVVDGEIATMDYILSDIYADGHPYGSRKLTPQEEYAELQRRFATFDPSLFSDPERLVEARKRLAELEEKFGPRPDMPILGRR